MRNFERDIVVEHYPEIQPALDEYGGVVNVVEQTADRMRRGCELNRDRYFRACHINPWHFGHYGCMTWLTDQAAEIPFPPTIYHATGIQAAITIGAGRPLLPLTEHMLGVPTHKGEALYLCNFFLDVLRINTGQLAEFLFSGPQVDAEQLDHALNLPYPGTKSYDKEVIGLFLADNGSRLNPLLATIIQALQDGLKPEHIPELKTVVDNYLADLYRFTFIREGWLNTIRDLFYGRQTTVENPFSVAGGEKINWRDVGEALLIVLSLVPDRKISRGILPGVSLRPAVLEIDTQRLISDLSPGGLFAFLVGDRPIGSIFTSLAITPGSVKTVYVHRDDLGKADNPNYKVNTFDDIPPASWLGGVNWRDVKPDMWNPLCGIRYADVPLTWLSLVKEGRIAPLMPISEDNIGLSRPVLESLFGSNAFGFTQSELYKSKPTLVKGAISYHFPLIDGVFKPVV